MKYKVFIFGTMEESQMVRFDLKENVELLGYLDNKKDCHEKGPLDGGLLWNQSRLKINPLIML